MIRKGDACKADLHSRVKIICGVSRGWKFMLFSMNKTKDLARLSQPRAVLHVGTLIVTEARVYRRECLQDDYYDLHAGMVTLARECGNEKSLWRSGALELPWKKTPPAVREKAYQESDTEVAINVQAILSRIEKARSSNCEGLTALAKEVLSRVRRSPLRRLKDFCWRPDQS